jgi:hypothetical protein
VSLLRHQSLVPCVAVLCSLLVGCDGAVEPEVSTLPQCESFAVDPEPPLSIERAREAHRRAELRRHLRMEEAVAPGSVLRRLGDAIALELQNDQPNCAQLAEAGRLIFEHEHGFESGLRRPFRRVQLGEFGGPETTTCRSCHWRGGPAGAGSVLDNSFILGDGDRISTADARNPPHLLGLSLVERLAVEMTQTLHAQRAALLASGPGEVSLEAKGVRFGTLRLTKSRRCPPVTKAAFAST